MSEAVRFLVLGLSIGFALGYTFEALRNFFMERR